VVQSLIDAGTLIKVQDETGLAIDLIPIMPPAWSNNIGNWRNTEGYKLRASAPTSLIVRGLPIYQPVAIDLLSGWNIISYPVSISQDALLVLNDLINSGHLVKVQSETGAAMEIMPGGTIWINNIGNFIPGKGYKVRVSDSELLTINPVWSGTGSTLKTSTIAAAPEYFKPVWKGNGLDHMNIYLSEITGETSVLKAGNEIGIFDGPNCVGAGAIQNTGDNFCSFVVSADDPTTAETDGFINGHTLSLKVWDPTTNVETPIKSIEFSQGSCRAFEPMASAAIRINSAVTGLDNELYGTTSLGNNYPNPFRGETTIPFVIGKETMVDISIYDMLGKKLNTLVQGNFQPGSYTTTWKTNEGKANRIKSGVYICKMQAGGRLFVKSMIVE
jgi:hypothetical protein